MARGWTTADVAAHFRKMGSESPVEDACGDGRQKRSKYGAAPKEERTADGIVFDSKAEMNAYLTLKIAQEAGLISSLELQPVFVLQEGFQDADGKKHRSITYRADFRFIREGQSIVVDVKGFQTEKFRLKLKLMKKVHPEVILEIWAAK